MQIKSKSRRNFLRNSAVATGGLSLGFTLSGCDSQADIVLAATLDTNTDLTAWLNVADSGIITIRVPSSEMGQGVHTSLPMIIAEQLDAKWADVRSETAPVTDEFVNPLSGTRGTGGSAAVRRWWPTIATVGATGRAMLVQAAANRWQVPAAELTAANSVVSHSPSNRQASYGELAAEASKLSLPQSPTLKNKADYQLIGKSARRLDTPSKVNGSAQFGIDVKVPGMVYAATSASPTFVGTLASMDVEAAKSSPGVLDVVRLPLTEPGIADVQSIVSLGDTVAVVGESYWQARKGMEALRPQFTDGGVAGVNSETLDRDFRAALNEPGVEVRNEGNTAQALSTASKLVEGEYTVPYLAHLTMEPMNCTGHYKADAVNGDSVELWAPTQGESHGIAVVSQAFGIPQDRVTIHTTLMGGGFGRRFEADFLLQSLRISKAVGRPVKMLWSREEDVQHDYYRPASASRFTVAVDDSGLPVAWKNEMACPSVAQRNFSAAMVNGFDPFSVEGAMNIPYNIPNQLVTLNQHDTHIPVGSWRSVGSSHNGFYVESMLDEVAQATDQDPFALRRKLLQAHPRFLTVLDELETQSQWQEQAPEGRFRGMAIHECFASIVGEVAEVSVDSQGKVKVHRMTCVVDCGEVVNPGIIESQMQSAMIDGITAAMRGGITIEEGRVKQSNFHDYKLMRMAEVPELAVHILQNEEAPGGVGEPGVPPSMPALTNAIFAATGRRIRSLPMDTLS